MERQHAVGPTCSAPRIFTFPSPLLFRADWRDGPRWGELKRYLQGFVEGM
jgi:hypothetical protein